MSPTRMLEPLPAGGRRVDTPGESIGRHAAGGAFWMLLAFGASKGLSFATSMVLARLLSPSEFGVVSFAMVGIGAFNLLQNFGVPAAIVHGERDIRETGGTALTINLVAAAALFVATVALAPTLAEFGGQEVIAPVMVALASGLILTALGSVHNAVLIKRLAFRRKLVPDVAPLVASGLVSIVMALSGFGVWSLVAAYLIKEGTSTILLWLLSSIRPWPRFRWPIAAELLRYGRHVSLTGLVGFASSNVDYFIVGHALGTARLGVYALAFMLANVPAVIMIQAISNVTFSAYSRVRSKRGELIDLFGDAFTVSSTLAGLLGVFLFAAGPYYVPLLLGPKWNDAVVPLQILVVYGVFRAMYSNFSSVYRAVGRPDAEWQLSLGRLVVLVPALVIATQHGITAVAAAQSAVMLCFVPVTGLVLLRLVDAPADHVRGIMAPPLAAGAAAAALVGGVYAQPDLRMLAQGQVGSVVLAAAGGAVYVGTLLRLNRRTARLARVLAGTLGGRLRGAGR
ncbi:MAG TPA: lipopolysaccharide biosynthesis protein [Chloroflexota bacterium]|nr:lipopolysaccharide biosynthesis protein [Chloroflexota bacterium]